MDALPFPKFDGPVDGVESIRPLGFAQVGCELADKVAFMKAKLMRSDTFLHLEAFEGVGAQMLNHLPQGSSIVEPFAVEGSSNSLRCRGPL